MKQKCNLMKWKSWSHSGLLDLQRRFGLNRSCFFASINPSLSFHSPVSGVSCGSKKWRDAISRTTSLISFHDRNEITEMKFRVSVSRKLWNEVEMKCLDYSFPSVEVKWNEVCVMDFIRWLGRINTNPSGGQQWHNGVSSLLSWFPDSDPSPNLSCSCIHQDDHLTWLEIGVPL